MNKNFNIRYGRELVPPLPHIGQSLQMLLAFKMVCSFGPSPHPRKGCTSPSGLEPTIVENGVCKYNNIRYAYLDSTKVFGQTSQGTDVSLGVFAPPNLSNTLETIPVESNPKNPGEESVRCIQLQSNSDKESKPTYARGQADCLALHIRAPKGAFDLPVAIFIHGGMYQVGAADEWAYEGESLALRKTIIVTINYRLNAIGFLPLSSDTWNNGLIDQRMGIEWVHQNIARFGGDPKMVTIFGESAGATSVIAQILYDQDGSDTAPIITQGISQSNPIGIQLYDKDETEALFNEALYQQKTPAFGGDKAFQCTDTDSQEHCKKDGLLGRQRVCSHADALLCTLTRISEHRDNLADFLSKASGAATAWGTTTNPRLISNLYALGPTNDGKFVKGQPMDTMPFIPIPLIVGTNLEEGFYFPSIMKDSIVGIFENSNLGGVGEAVADNIPKSLLADLAYGGRYLLRDHPVMKYYEDNTVDGEKLTNWQFLGATFTDYMFYCPIVLRPKPKNAYYYQNQNKDACSAPSKEAGDCGSIDYTCVDHTCHANEVPVVFGTWGRTEESCCEPDDAAKFDALTETMQDLWSKFFHGEEPWDKSNTFILTNIGSASPAASGKSEAHASIGDAVCYEYYEARYPPFGASDRDTAANQTAATSFIPWGR